MLFNPLWKNKSPTKEQIFSVKGLIAWLETQDPNTEYNYDNVYDCLITRYLIAHGYTHNEYSEFCSSRVRTDIASFTQGNTTYGAALQRARRIDHGLLEV